MKHCHFSILYNELPFLKQKLPFLYEYFDQIIFYDLNTFTDVYTFSTDGSHEFIKNYPDPERKITFIERKNLHRVKPVGTSNMIKRKMFSLGSDFVKPEMDVFWCTDMDEFFNESLIKEVETLFNRNQDIKGIDVDHFIFWKDLNTIMASTIKKLSTPFYTRIAKHEDGNKYGHCTLSNQFKPRLKTNSKIYHFAFVGEPRTSDKLFKYYSGTNPFYKSTWDADWKSTLSKGTLSGYPFMHPSTQRKMGITLYPNDIEKDLPYINFDELANDLNCEFSRD